MDPIHAHRASTLTAIAALAEKHDLPLPMTISLSHDSLELRFDDEGYAAVAAWADVLDLPPVRAHDLLAGPRGFVSVDTEKHDAWLGWYQVRSWAACWFNMPARDDDPDTTQPAGGAA